MLDLETRRLFAAGAIALRYPERSWLKSFEDIENELSQFSDETKEVLWQLLSYFGSRSLLDLQMDYVSLFDRKRRACLYLSYYLNGDTRRRGMALLNFKETFAAEGWRSTNEELDDYLPTLLEFISVTDSPLGFSLLQQHKAGVSLLAIALRDMGSPYALLVNEILLRIPGDENPVTLKLIETGPPMEMVGLSPYGTEDNSAITVGAKC
ncbi:MAG: nitrate reductase molybdenum cofactor assembly chaperone [Actinobacteria bacterium]|nr:nitrate reductase molybdenum cofactor assembly chaperone [Actinomycetota bacterium]